MRRSALAGISISAVLAVAACAPDSVERGPLVPTEPSFAASPQCAGGLASDIAKQHKVLYSGAALTDIQAKFDAVKSDCPGIAGDATLMDYLKSTITHRPDNVKSISEARAQGIVNLWKLVALYFTNDSSEISRPFTVLTDSGGAEVLSPGESMTTFDKGAKLTLDANSSPSIAHLFTFERRPTSECDGTTSLNVTRNGASLQGNGTGCYDVKDYPHETSYTPAATITLCLQHGSELDEEIGLVHQKGAFGAELLPDVSDTHSCSDFHASTNSWLRRNGGSLGSILASAYDYVRPRSLFADDVGESGSIGSFSLVGAALNEIFEDDFTDLVSPPDIGDTWTINATFPGYIQLQNGIADLTGSVVVLSQAQGNCANCPVFSLLGTRVNSSQTETIGTYEVTWQSVQTKPNVKEAPFVVLNDAGAEIARLSYVTESSVNKLLFTAGGVTTNVGSWVQNVSQAFKITVNLTTLNPATSNKVSFAFGPTPLTVATVATNPNVIPNATTLKQIGYVLTGIDAGIIGADNFRVLRLSDVP